MSVKVAGFTAAIMADNSSESVLNDQDTQIPFISAEIHIYGLHTENSRFPVLRHHLESRNRNET
jgi:hypothetical protein